MYHSITLWSSCSRCPSHLSHKIDWQQIQANLCIWNCEFW